MAENTSINGQILEALARGDKMTAIRLARQSGVGGLKEAVEFVESHGGDARGIPQRVQKAVDAARSDSGQHGQHSHAQSMQHALRANNRRPTVVAGDAPGNLRWVMIALGLLALAVWLLFH